MQTAGFFLNFRPPNETQIFIIPGSDNTLCSIWFPHVRIYLDRQGRYHFFSSGLQPYKDMVAGGHSSFYRVPVVFLHSLFFAHQATGHCSPDCTLHSVVSGWSGTVLYLRRLPPRPYTPYAGLAFSLWVLSYLGWMDRGSLVFFVQKEKSGSRSQRSM